MNTTAPTDPSRELQRLHELLPFHAVGALVGEDQHFVQTWLAQHGAAHPDVLSELAWLRRTSTQARENAFEPEAQAGLGELMARIAAERAPKATPANAPSTWSQRISDWLAPRRPALALALAAVVLLQTAVIGTLVQRDAAEQLPLASGGTPVAADQVVFTVAFKGTASEAELRALLLASGVQVVGGPSALGLWRVATDKAAADAALARLRAASSLVESVQREP